jgi:NDP-hexose 4-ketoreductase
MRRALVIAGNSFVGRHIQAELRSNSFDVIGTVRCKTPATSSSSSSSSSAICDVTDPANVAQVLRDIQPDCVVQCAGVTSAQDAELARQVHVDGTTNVLNALREHVPEASFVAIGSAAEYGPTPLEHLPLGESFEPRPASVYGETKLAQTRLVEQSAADGMTAYVVRPFNIIGPGLPLTYFAAGLAERLRLLSKSEPEEFEVFNVNATRDFVDVRDVARAIRLLLSHPAEAQGDRPEASDSIVYNVCSNTQTTMLAVASFMGELAGGHKPVGAGEADSRSGISFSQGSFDKLRNRCQWQPEIDWQTSIRDLWNAFID